MNIAIATGWTDSPLSRASSTIRRNFGAGLQALQYAQMIAVMNRLPDDYLDKAGLRRGEIPEHARRAIYGDEPASRE
jgi:uncharacterized protein YjiS (DUF1127 family)